MLGKFAWEVIELMSLDEYTHWVALLDLQRKEREKAARKAQKGSRTRGL